MCNVLNKYVIMKDFHSRMETGATNGAGTDYPSGAPEFTPGFCVVRVAQSVVSV